MVWIGWHEGFAMMRGRYSSSAATTSKSIGPGPVRRLPCGGLAARRPGGLTWRWTVTTRAEAGGSGGGGGGGQDASISSMDMETAREMLGVREGATFDEVLRAKKKLAASSDLDPKVLDAAYDKLLMGSLRDRQEGRGVSKDVRYADVPKAKPVSQVANELLQKLPGNVQVSVGSRGTGGKGGEGASGVMDRLAGAANPQNVIFGLVSLWVLAQAASSPLNYPYDTPGSQIAAAVIASVYFQRQEKGQRLGRALGITFAGLCVGTLVGSGLEALLRVDIAPILGVHTPAMVIGEFSVIGVWLACAFLL